MAGRQTQRQGRLATPPSSAASHRGRQRRRRTRRAQRAAPHLRPTGIARTPVTGPHGDRHIANHHLPQPGPRHRRTGPHAGTLGGHHASARDETGTDPNQPSSEATLQQARDDETSHQGPEACTDPDHCETEAGAHHGRAHETASAKRLTDRSTHHHLHGTRPRHRHRLRIRLRHSHHQRLRRGPEHQPRSGPRPAPPRRQRHRRITLPLLVGLHRQLPLATST